MVRIPLERADLSGEGALQVLLPEEQLVAFEDFSFGSEAWSPDGAGEAPAHLGDVLGPYTSAAAERQFDLPSGAASVRIRFDVHLIGDWPEGSGIDVNVGGEALARIYPGPDAPTPDGMDAELGAWVMQVRARAASDTAPGIETYRVILRVAAPLSELDLQLHPEAGANAEGDLTWALDNLVAVVDGVPQGS